MEWVCWLANAALTDAVVNLLGLTSVGLLAVPALHADQYGRLIARLSAASPNISNPNISEADKAALDELQKLQAEWTAGKSFCLKAGTALAGISCLLGLLKAIFGPATL